MVGYFHDDSAIRRVGRESILLLGGPRALLMQAAHPLVAAGIVDHSRYREDPWRRLARTMAALFTIVFGSCAEADRMGAMTRAAHARVRGVREGRRYSAADPDLMLWVHSTLVDTGLTLYDLYVHPLEAAVAEEFYEQMKLVATVFGVPDGVHPPSLADFRRYQRDAVASGTVRVGDDARAVAETVLSPPVPLPLRLPLATLARQTAGLLPPQLREQYGLRAPLPGAAFSTRRLLPLVPAPLRRTERLPLRLLTAVAGL